MSALESHSPEGTSNGHFLRSCVPARSGGLFIAEGDLAKRAPLIAIRCTVNAKIADQDRS